MVLLVDSACALTVTGQSTLRRSAPPAGYQPALTSRAIRGGSLGEPLHRSLVLAQWDSADSCEAAVPLRRLFKTRESRR
jgi:hypothetical protein